MIKLIDVFKFPFWVMSNLLKLIIFVAGRTFLVLFLATDWLFGLSRSKPKPKFCQVCGLELKWSGYDEDGRPGGRAECPDQKCEFNKDKRSPTKSPRWN